MNSDGVVKLIGGIVCAVAVFSDGELLGLWLRGSNSSSKSFSGRGALGMVSSEHLVALQALLWCPYVTKAWSQVLMPTCFEDELLAVSPKGLVRGKRRQREQ